MNKRGQTLILFIILIPIILGIGAFVIDTGLIVSKNTQLKEVSKTIIKRSFNENEEVKIEDIYLDNNIPVDQLKVEINDNYIKIKNEYYIDSIFGKIIGLDKYKIKIDIIGRKDNDKIVFE